jgi:aryl-alcohol dehydrogenase-like predicted oxidoreductase
MRLFGESPLSEFWDSHDLTDFEDELEEAADPVFVRSTAFKVPLEVHEAEALERMAQAKGVSPQQLVRVWVLQTGPVGTTRAQPIAEADRGRHPGFGRRHALQAAPAT